jgi:hypothetical protein
MKNEYLKDRINELGTSYANKNMKDTCREVNGFDGYTKIEVAYSRMRMVICLQNVNILNKQNKLRGP